MLFVHGGVLYELYFAPSDLRAGALRGRWEIGNERGDRVASLSTRTGLLTQPRAHVAVASGPLAGAVHWEGA